MPDDFPHVIKERCPCGAKVKVESITIDGAATMAREWREGHKHLEMRGKCPEAQEIRLFSQTENTWVVCELGADHTGTHEDGDGHRWLTMRASVPGVPCG